MILGHQTWPDIEALEKRHIVVLIPTGSLEQHGPHLPLFTDSLLVTAAAKAIEGKLPTKILLTPTLWLGASGHHLKFAGSLSNGFDSYMGAIESVVESLIPHGFTKFFLINGHGGNTDPNGMVLRSLKARHPESTFGHSGYFAYIGEAIKDIMEGPVRDIRHACEAEASLMLHLHPDLVRKDKLRDDGLKPEPAIRGLVHHFDEITEQGSLGYATLATGEKGKRLFELAIANAVKELKALADGYVLSGPLV